MTQELLLVLARPDVVSASEDPVFGWTLDVSDESARVRAVTAATFAAPQDAFVAATQLAADLLDHASYALGHTQYITVLSEGTSEETARAWRGEIRLGLFPAIGGDL